MLCEVEPNAAAAAVAAALPHLTALHLAGRPAPAFAAALPPAPAAPLRQLRSLALTFPSLRKLRDWDGVRRDRIVYDVADYDPSLEGRRALRGVVASMPALEAIRFHFHVTESAGEDDVIAWLQAAPQLRSLWVSGVGRVTAATAAAVAEAPVLRSAMLAVEPGGIDASLDVAVRAQLQAAKPWLTFEVVPVWTDEDRYPR